MIEDPALSSSNDDVDDPMINWGKLEQPPASTTDTKPKLLETTLGDIADAEIFNEVFGANFDSVKLDGYCKKLIAASGWKGDPFELMLIEQVSLAHLMVTMMHHKTVVARDAETFEVHASAAARLMGEQRRTILAIKDYKSPNPTPRNKKTSK